jgi:hypothetical protein
VVELAPPAVHAAPIRLSRDRRPQRALRAVHHLVTQPHDLLGTLIQAMRQGVQVVWIPVQKAHAPAPNVPYS